jgi:hypothetical protein
MSSELDGAIPLRTIGGNPLGRGRASNRRADLEAPTPRLPRYPPSSGSFETWGKDSSPGHP